MNKNEKTKKINEMIEIKELKKFLLSGGIYFVLIIIFGLIVLKDPSFLSFRNAVNLLTQSSVKMIIALGVASIIVTQGTDLSAGRQIGIAGLVSATLLQSIANPNKIYKALYITEPTLLHAIIVLLLVILIGAIIGLINGFLVAKLNVVPFVTTMGMMIIAYGANSLYFDYIGSTPVAGFSPIYRSIVGNIVLKSTDSGVALIYIPKLVIYAIIAIAIMWIVWNKTVFGKNLFAVGGNPEAAKVSGVNVTKTIMIVYILSGIMYAIGGFLEAARIGSASNNLGNLYELDAIAACVVGGVSFSGGVGKIQGVVAGVIIFTMINYGLTYIAINPYWQYIIKGIIIVTAVAIDVLKYKKRV